MANRHVVIRIPRNAPHGNAPPGNAPHGNAPPGNAPPGNAPPGNAMFRTSSVWPRF